MCCFISSATVHKDVVESRPPPVSLVKVDCTHAQTEAPLKQDWAESMQGLDMSGKDAR